MSQKFLEYTENEAKVLCRTRRDKTETTILVKAKQKYPIRMKRKGYNRIFTIHVIDKSLIQGMWTSWMVKTCFWNFFLSQAHPILLVTAFLIEANVTVTPKYTFIHSFPSLSPVCLSACLILHLIQPKNVTWIYAIELAYFVLMQYLLF